MEITLMWDCGKSSLEERKSDGPKEGQQEHRKTAIKIDTTASKNNCDRDTFQLLSFIANAGMTACQCNTEDNFVYVHECLFHMKDALSTQ